MHIFYITGFTVWLNFDANQRAVVCFILYNPTFNVSHFNVFLLKIKKYSLQIDANVLFIF